MQLLWNRQHASSVLEVHICTYASSYGAQFVLPPELCPFTCMQVSVRAEAKVVGMRVPCLSFTMLGSLGY